jgi:hypothetical protein
MARLWQCLAWWETGNTLRLERSWKSCSAWLEHRYNYIFTRRTLLGPPDVRCLVPLLIFCP